MDDLTGASKSGTLSTIRAILCRTFTYAVVSRALALLLLLAAVLKARGSGTEYVPGISWLSSPRWEITIIEGEGLLGIWLLTGLTPRACRSAALVVFVLLGSVSLYLALDGQGSCGCFGQIRVNPWITLGVDATAVATLLVLRPVLGGSSILPAFLMHTLFGAAIILAILSASLFLFIDHPRDFLARLRGEVITVEPQVTTLGEGVSGEEREFEVQVYNHYDRSVCLIGGTSNCSCNATSSLPLNLAPGEIKAVRISGRFGGSRGIFRREFVMYTNCEEQPLVKVRFNGRVTSNAD